MKIKKFVKGTCSIALCAAMIFSNLSGLVLNQKTISVQAASKNYELVSDVQDAAILHCWNWSYSTIEQHLELIAECGYSAIQTSPATQPKDYKWKGEVGMEVGIPGKGGSGNWWKVYQPVTISVCDNGETWFGTKEELESLCKKAEEYGIKVIVDVVANHLGNIAGWKNSLSDVSPQVGEFWNPEMLTDESYWHINDIQVWHSDGRRDVTQGTMGMPDLNTADSRVQKYYKDLLIELIDCGVDGFRFDAAKHIETPDDDPSFASNFWPNVLNPAESHYKSKTGGDLYVYGEILNMVGDGLSIDAYTKYMSVTDNSAGNQCLDSFRNNQIGNISMHYSPNKSVLWAESHDTFMNESSRYGSDKSIVRTWSYVANKNGAASLFFVRPYYSKDILNGDKDGDFRGDLETSLEPAIMGECPTYVWASKEVAAINHFKNRMKGQAESYGSSGNVGYCRRGNGVILVNMSGAGSVSVNVGGLSNGTYKDEVSGNTFTVSGGNVSGTIGSEYGIAVIYQNTMPNPNEKRPVQISASVSNGSIYYTNGLNVTVNAKGATSATYSTSTGESGSFTESKDITIGKGLSDGETLTLTITATNSYGTVKKVFTYTKDSKTVEIVADKEDGSKFYTDGFDLTIEAVSADSATYSASTGEKGSFTGSTTVTIGAGLSNGETVTITVTGTNAKGTVTEIFTYTKSDSPLGTAVLFKNTSGWSKVNAYAWNSSSDKMSAWPGTEMKVFDASKNIYIIEFKNANAYKNIIFNNGSSKTDDLTIPGMGYVYDYSTKKWTQYEEPVIQKPTVNATLSSGEVTGATSVTYTVKNATSATYSINGGSKVSFSGSVTLTVGNNATDNIVITATNEAGTTTKTYTYTCKKEDELTASLTGNKNSLKVGDNLVLSVNVSGGKAPYTYTYVVKNQTTNESTNLLENTSLSSYTWTAVSTGTRTFYVDVKDANGNTIRTNGVTATVTQPVTELKASASSNATNVAVGQSVTFKATATGGKAPYKYSYIVFNQTTNSWARLVDKSSSNTYTWTAGSEGTRIFYIDVTDATGKTVRCNELKVITAGPSVELKASATASATSVSEGQSVTFKATATGGTAPYKYSYIVFNQTTNSWARLVDKSSSNTFIWTAGSEGTRIFYVDVTDATGKTVRCNELKVVTSGSTELKASATASATSVSEGQSVTFKATATGGSGSYKYSFIVFNETTNSWFRFVDKSSSNTFTWTGGNAGTRIFYVDVTDATGKTVRCDAIKVVTGTKSSLAVVGSATSANISVGGSVVIIGTALDGTAPYTYSFVVFNQATGTWYRYAFGSSNILTWTAGSVGTRTFYVEAKDSTGTVVRSSGVNISVK